MGNHTPPRREFKRFDKKNLAPQRRTGYNAGMKRLGLILAPHPDDECITGLLPLRLQEEAGFTICAVPVTLGSHRARQAARRKEYVAA